jgi:ATP synthase subunit 6
MLILANPLEQFKVTMALGLPVLIDDMKLDFGGFYTNYGIIVLIYLAFFFYGTSVFTNSFVFSDRYKKGYIKSLKAIESLTNDYAKKADRVTVFALLYPYFIVLFCGNFLGLIPYNLALTSQLIIVTVLSLSLFLFLNFASISEHGLEFFKLFLPAGTPFFLIPLLVPVELLSYTFRLVSITVRLFANIMAGHTLLKVFAGFSWYLFNSSGILGLLIILPFLGLGFLVCLEFAVALIQGLVFLTLAAMYIEEAVALAH